MLKQPNLKPLLRAKLIELLLRHESEQSQLKADREARRHEQRKDRQEIEILKTLNASLKKRLTALEEEVLKEQAEPKRDPVGEYLREYGTPKAEQVSEGRGTAHQEAAANKQEQVISPSREPFVAVP